MVAALELPSPEAVFNFENVAVLPLWGLGVVAPQWVGLGESDDVLGNPGVRGGSVLRIVVNSPFQCLVGVGRSGLARRDTVPKGTGQLRR